ncbi:SDR family oxidoreductase [Microbulbifer sp. YPW1]|uniref:SDR family oxidoreductase n=1 Tax=Microbulbifer sp. YPW1 TaxID=2745199 RepID=UPI00159B493E|nr:SDR family oxidoreductase [Microbulbifer sp. YPW1]QKX17204.1 SDR family oxidoreductase [Microbulbifer sp. YPW1]
MKKIQNVLITGCSTGIGRALAQELARRGCRVYATARRPEVLEDIASENLIPLRLDVLDRRSVEDALNTVVSEAGSIDMLINNAGVSSTAPAVEADFEQLKGLVDTNLTACIGITQAVFPHMAAQGYGRIVNVGSVVGELPAPFTATYCATKAAIHMFSDVLRMELLPFNIEVTTVQPAAVSTEIETRSATGVEMFGSADSRYQKYYAGIRKRFEGGEKVAMSAEDFAAQVAPKLLLSRAPRIVSGGGNNRLLRTLAKLPVSLRDWLLRKEYQLS